MEKSVYLSIPVITHENQLTGVLRRKMTTVTKALLFKFYFNLQVCLSFQVVLIFGIILFNYCF